VIQCRSGNASEQKRGVIGGRIAARSGANRDGRPFRTVEPPLAIAVGCGPRSAIAGHGMRLPSDETENLVRDNLMEMLRRYCQVGPCARKTATL